MTYLMRVKHPLSAETKLNISIWCSWCWCIPGWILPRTKGGVSDMTAWYDAGESCARWTVSCPSSPALYILAGAADHRRMWCDVPSRGQLVMATYQIKLLPHYTHPSNLRRSRYISIIRHYSSLYLHTLFLLFCGMKIFSGLKKKCPPW